MPGTEEMVVWDARTSDQGCQVDAGAVPRELNQVHMGTGPEPEMWELRRVDVISKSGAAFFASALRGQGLPLNWLCTFCRAPEWFCFRALRVRGGARRLSAAAGVSGHADGEAVGPWDGKVLREVGAVLCWTLDWGAHQEHTWPRSAARTSCEVLANPV